MDKPKQKFPDGVKVRLKDGVHPSFYEDRGLPGNEGWIRKHEQEEYGYYRVFIEWDKDHWAYNGTKDRWTWEDHFELVEDAMSEKDDKEKKDDLSSDKIAEVVAKVLATLAVPEPNTKPLPDSDAEPIEIPVSAPEDEEDDLPPDMFNIFDHLYDEDEDEQPAYDETLKKAIESAEDAEAFVIITISKEEIKGGPHKQIAVPMVYHNAKDMESSLIAHLYLTQLSGDFIMRMVADRLRAEKAVEEME